MTGRAESGAITGKGLTYGGSKVRLEAAGFGAVYFLARMIEHNNDTLEGKRIVISGFGNMAWGVCRKAAQLGSKVVTLSGPDGYIYDAEGVTTDEKLEFLYQMRISGMNKVQPYAERFGVPFFANKKPWEVSADIVMPCAVENEIGFEDAKRIIENGTTYYVEAANMPATNEAIRLLRSNSRILCAGAKAAGSGGVIVSALEMAQNSLRYNWRRAEVDARLQCAMNAIYDASVLAAEKFGLGYDLIAGNNIAAFERIAQAMLAQGM